jgi:hypothetical protein
MRLNERWSVCESVETSSVLANPGTPTSNRDSRQDRDEDRAHNLFPADNDLAQLVLIWQALLSCLQPAGLYGCFRFQPSSLIKVFLLELVEN